MTLRKQRSAYNRMRKVGVSDTSSRVAPQENDTLVPADSLYIWDRSFFICVKGISQAGMPAFQFGAAREREKLAERVSHRCPEKERRQNDVRKENPLQNLP